MNSTVSKRNFLSYSLLNAVSYGIYGIVARNQIDADIETVCAQDGQKPDYSFVKAWLMSKVYNLMVVGIVGIPVIIALAVASTLTYFASGFLVFLVGFAALLVAAFIVEGIYMPSWWYTQHNRLVLNSHRYKMVLNDNAFDTAVWKSIMYIPMNIFSIIGYVLCIAGVVGFIACAKMDEVAYGILCIFGGYLLGAIALFIKNIINLPLYYTIKSLNRFSENMAVTYAEPYNPTGLLDEDNKDNIFSRLINVLNSFGTDKVAKVDDSQTVIGSGNSNPIPGGGVYVPPENPPEVVIPRDGSIECTSGTNKGYVYSIRSGEELIIGKDPKTASIVISPEFKDVSRKHCGIKFSSSAASYVVTDYSSNGTKVNNAKLEPGKPTRVSKGSIISLGKGDNVFVVK